MGCFVVPEALAVPYAQQLGLDTAAAGLLMAADPAGSVLGGWLFIRFVPDSLRTRTIGPLALAAALPLGLCGLEPGFGTTLVLWGVSGAFATASLVQAQAEFVRVTPGELRGRAIGVAAAGLIGVQGLAVLLGGVAAQVWGRAGGRGALQRPRSQSRSSSRMRTCGPSDRRRAVPCGSRAGGWCTGARRVTGTVGHPGLLPPVSLHRRARRGEVSGAAGRFRSTAECGRRAAVITLRDDGRARCTRPGRRVGDHGPR